MATKIRHTKDLPEWFDLGKYDGLANLNLAGWYEQLIVREHLQVLVGSGSHEHLVRSGVQELLDLVRAVPIFDVNIDNPIVELLQDGRLMELKSRSPKFSTGVYTATVADIYRAERNLFAPVAFHARQYFSRFLYGDVVAAARDIGSREWMNEPINDVSESGDRTLLSINTSLPDAVLIQQFIQLLPSLRKAGDRHLEAKQHRKPDLKGWISAGLLPYIDLRLWAKINNVKISNRVMADAIFPPGEGGEEMVRKTTGDVAKRVFVTSYLYELASLAGLEIAEENAA